MKRIRILVVAAVAVLAAGLLVVPVLISAPADAQTAPTYPCPLPRLAQQLTKDAAYVEPTTNGARFYMRPVAMQGTGFGDLGLNTSVTPPASHSGDWKGWGQAWIAWTTSTPCSGPDGYALGFNTRCYNGNTLVLCNFEGEAGLEYDHAAADWDGVWGYRYYHEFNESSCADPGGTYHFFDDNSPGRLRTLIRFHFRFLAIDYLTQYRRMTSGMVRISDHAVFPAIDWTTNGAGSTPPGTQSTRTEC